jgi:hypothetical protein
MFFAAITQECLLDASAKLFDRQHRIVFPALMSTYIKQYLDHLLVASP